MFGCSRFSRNSSKYCRDDYVQTEDISLTLSNQFYLANNIDIILFCPTMLALAILLSNSLLLPTPFCKQKSLTIIADEAFCT